MKSVGVFDRGSLYTRRRNERMGKEKKARRSHTIDETQIRKNLKQEVIHTKQGELETGRSKRRTIEK